MAPSSFPGAARWAQRAHSTDGQNTGGAAEGASGLALALRTARCQNKTGRSFPRRRPNSSQRQLGARDFKWRRTGCLAGAAGMKQRLLPGPGRGLRVLPARLRRGNELTERRGLGRVFPLFLEMFLFWFSQGKGWPGFLVLAQILECAAASPLRGDCWGQSLTKCSFGSRASHFCSEAPRWWWVGGASQGTMAVCPTWQNTDSEDFSSIWRAELCDVNGRAQHPECTDQIKWTLQRSSQL